MCLIFKYIHNRNPAVLWLRLGIRNPPSVGGLHRGPLNNETVLIGRWYFQQNLDLGSTSNKQLQTFLLHPSKKGNHYYLVHTFLGHVLKVFERIRQADSLWMGLLKFRLRKESSVWRLGVRVRQRATKRGPWASQEPNLIKALVQIVQFEVKSYDV